MLDRTMPGTRPEPQTPDYTSMPWRSGRHLGHTVYAMSGPEASDSDTFLFTTGRGQESLAAHLIELHNAKLHIVALWNSLKSQHSEVTKGLREFTRDLDPMTPRIESCTCEGMMESGRDPHCPTHGSFKTHD
jgi:hypothetical protein